MKITECGPKILAFYKKNQLTIKLGGFILVIKTITFSTLTLGILETHERLRNFKLMGTL